MLYWHLGLKRTGTTSLQTALVVHQERLAEAGIVYPQEWRTQGFAGYSTHQGLTEVVAASAEDASPVLHFREYLSAHADRSVILSSEFVSGWLTDEKRDAVLRTLSWATEVMPVSCIWTLRRLDDQLNSLCLRRALLGIDLTFPSQEDVSGIVESFSELLAGMRSIEEAVGRVAYVKYKAAGAHNGEILREMGVPDGLRCLIEGSLECGPRLNPQLTYKGAVALYYRDLLGERAGVALSGPDLQRALFLGEFRFDDDKPCELIGSEVRATLHERALTAARQHRLDAYPAFFENDGIEAGPPIVLDPDALTDADLEGLVSYLGEQTQRDIDTAIRQGYRAPGPSGFTGDHA